jgi:hypothetical protein
MNRIKVFCEVGTESLDVFLRKLQTSKRWHLDVTS